MSHWCALSFWYFVLFVICYRPFPVTPAFAEFLLIRYLFPVNCFLVTAEFPALQRINCDIAKEVLTVSESALDGWDFHILTANIDLHKNTDLALHLLSYLVSDFLAHPTLSDLYLCTLYTKGTQQ